MTDQIISIGCTGNTTVYEKNNLNATFKNFCGDDIQAAVDMSNSPQATWDDCLDACIESNPLCYGFDYGPFIDWTSSNCWLMGKTFPDDSPQPAEGISSCKLDTNSLPGLSDACPTERSSYSVLCGVDIAGNVILNLAAASMNECLDQCDKNTSCHGVAYESGYDHGLLNCYLKDSNVGTTTTRDYATISAATKVYSSTQSSTQSTSSAESTSTAVTNTSAQPTSTNTSTAPASDSSDGGLSTGAKAGIGAGVGVAALVAILAAGFFILRRRKKQKVRVTQPAMQEHRAPAELPGPRLPTELHTPTSYKAPYSKPDIELDASSSSDKRE